MGNRVTRWLVAWRLGDAGLPLPLRGHCSSTTMWFMSNSPRGFFSPAAIALAGVTAGCQKAEQTPPQPTPGAPPAFGTTPAVGPEVSPRTFSEAEKLVQVDMSAPEREVAANSWRATTAG